MAVHESTLASEALGPLVGELERHGCSLTIVDGPTWTGQVVVRVMFPEDEYLEKRCRRLLDQSRAA